MTHPAILLAERTGYPYPVYEEKFIGCCCICGKDIYEFDAYITVGFEDEDIICEVCKYDDAS